MITDLRSITPFIHFGFFLTEKTVESETIVDVWLQTLYKQKDYEMVISTDLVVEKISDYRYKVTASAPGTHEIKLFVSLSKDKDVTLISNTITLTVE